MRRASGLMRATSFKIKDSSGKVLARGMTDPSGTVCGATAWIEVEDENLEIEE